MSLSPSLAVTPLSPRVTSYDGAFWTAVVSFCSYGGYTYFNYPNTLENNCNLDRITVRADDNLDNTLNSGTYWYRHSCFYTHVRLNDGYWASDTQVIMIFDVESATGTQGIQAFVGWDLVRDETIDGRENIVIAYDFTPNVTVIIRPKTIYEKLRFYKASVYIV